MASTLKSNDISISDILKEISKGEIQLPDFQRGWVWDNERIIGLIASISNSYPVGALMFLEYGGDSVRFKHRSFTGATASCAPEMLVLDGQQRLTSVFCALFSREAVPTRTDKNKDIKRFYYVDIDKSLDSTIDRVDAVISVPEDRIIKSNFGRDIDLDVSTREKEFENHLFPLNIIFDLIECNNWQNEYQKYHNYSPAVLDCYANFHADILVPIQSYQVPVITLSKNTPKEAVCQVFENVNTGGVSLTVFELMTATFAADNFQLRKDWEERQERLVKESALSASNIDSAVLSVVSSTDFLIASTLLSRYYIKVNGGEAVSCKKKDVLRLSLQEYKDYKEKLTNGFIQAASFLKEQRIFSARDLPYSTQLIPLSVMFAILGSKAHDASIKYKLSRWYWCGVFGEMYGGANETRYANDVTGMMEWITGGEEPDTIKRAYFQPTRLLSLQTRLSAAYKGIMALILKIGCLDFISGSAMDFTVFLDESTDIHHIFPRAYCEAEKLPRTKWNSIINKTPLFARTNRIIGGSAPSIYLKKIEKDGHVSEEQLDRYVVTHLIDVGNLRADDFDAYFINRAKAILEKISQAMGKQIANLSGEDIILAFGKPLD